MNEQIMTEVLNDILDELKQSNQLLKNLQVTINDLRERTTGFEQKLTGQQVIAPPADTTAIRELTDKAMTTLFLESNTQLATIRGEISDKMNTISTIVREQPKNVIRQHRISFFPDNDINGSFRNLLNKIVLLIICLTIIFATWSLIRHYIDRPQPTPPTSAIIAPPSKEIPDHGPAANGAKNTLTTQDKKKLKKYLDTLYKKYMYKKADSSNEFQEKTPDNTSIPPP